MNNIWRSAFRPAAAAMLLVATGVLAACGGSTPPEDPAASPVAAAPEAGARAQDEQARFVIHGEVPTLKDGTQVKLNMFTGPADSMDSLKTVAEGRVEHGQFTLQGPVTRPTQGFLLFDGQGSVQMVVSKGRFEVLDTGAGLAVKGGKLNDIVYGYARTPSYIAARKAKNEAYHEVFDGIDETDEAKMKAAREYLAPYSRKLRSVIDDYQARILDGDGTALSKLFVLSGNYDWKRYPPEMRKDMLDSYAEELGDHPLLKRMRASAKANARSAAIHEALAKGKPYRDITAADKNGREVRLADVLAGNRLVLLDFWASWCGPCRGEFPHLSKVYREFHDQGFEIYAVSLDEDRDEWLKALQEEGANGHIPWINLRDGGMKSASATTYGVLGLPSNYLIAGDGTIVGVNMREWDVERAVRAAIEKLETSGD